MLHNFQFNPQVFKCVVGGVSVLDIPGLNVQNLEQAKEFVSAYGYDLDQPSHREQLWSIHQRAVTLIRDNLLEKGEAIPDQIFDQQKLGSLSELLILASQRNPETVELRKWACAVLRVMHVYVHLRNDLFSAFNEEIQGQILGPLQESISADPMTGAIAMGGKGQFDTIELHKFDIKPFKTTASSVIKLLARPERVALTLLDKLGVRFVTRDVYDSFRVIRYLAESHILSYAHIIPDQSNNTLFPLNLFLESMQELSRSGLEPDVKEINERLEKKLLEARGRAEYLEKANSFSGDEYRFIKFINRKLITVTVGHGPSERPFRFFYPYEIQIVDQQTYEKNLVGPMAHDEYKNRQRLKARERVFGAQAKAEVSP